MFPLFKSEVKTYHTLFHKERKKAFEGFAFLTSIANEISSEALSCNDEDQVVVKLKMLKRFSHIFEEFNHDVELTMSQFDKRMIEVGKRANAGIEHPLVGPPSRIPRADLSVYKTGDRGKCVISYIKSIENDLCFIVDINRPHNADFGSHLIDRYDGMPDIGTVFAILIENKYFRAIRTHSEATLVSYQVTLIDIGETITLPLYRSDKFQLSPEALRVPPMAILCLVEKVDGRQTNCLQRSLGRKRFEFQINNVCANMLQVELFTESENLVTQMGSLMITMPTGAMSQPSTPMPSRRSHWDNVPTEDCRVQMSAPVTRQLSRRLTCESSVGQRNTNPFRDGQLDNIRNALDYSPMKSNFVTSSPYPLKDTNNYQNDFSETKTILPRNNVNRLPADPIDGNHSFETNNSDTLPIAHVMPTPSCPKEDDTGSCQTGAYPKCAESMENNENGHTMNAIRCQSIGQQFDVIPCAVASCDEIYVQRLNSAGPFKHFQQNLNQIAETHAVTKLPSVGEYVLARYDVDGLIYRAQVTQLVDRQTLLVFYVDYGNIERVTLDSVFGWTSFCDSIPFQARKFTLANAKAKEGLEREVKDFLFQHVLNKPMKATVTATAANRIMVRLTNANGSDIAEQLQASDLCHKS